MPSIGSIAITTPNTLFPLRFIDACLFLRGPTQAEPDKVKSKSAKIWLNRTVAAALSECATGIAEADHTV